MLLFDDLHLSQIVSVLRLLPSEQPRNVWKLQQSDVSFLPMSGSIWLGLLVDSGASVTQGARLEITARSRSPLTASEDFTEPLTLRGQREDGVSCG